MAAGGRRNCGVGGSGSRQHGRWLEDWDMDMDTWVTSSNRSSGNGNNNNNNNNNIDINDNINNTNNNHSITRLTSSKRATAIQVTTTTTTTTTRDMVIIIPHIFRAGPHWAQPWSGWRAASSSFTSTSVPYRSAGGGGLTGFPRGESEQDMINVSKMADRLADMNMTKDGCTGSARKSGPGC